MISQQSPAQPAPDPSKPKPPGRRTWMDRVFRRGQPDIPVLRLVGPIGQGGPGRSGLSLAGLEQHIAHAFSMKGPVVALLVNSPGGSPVQSALIARRIRDLAQEKDKTVIAFVEDVAASGGYWLACAADEIVADSSSIVGSIGVISAGFGFPGLLDRIGVERRVYTAGDRKLILDPFSPERQDDVDKLLSLQKDVHQAFIKMVRDRRGERLEAASNGPEKAVDIFNGEFWSGDTALTLGLVDSIDHMRPFLRARYGEKLRLRTVNPDKPSIRRRLGLAGLIGGLGAGGGAGKGAGDGGSVTADDARALAHGVLDAVDERGFARRYDLS